MQRAPSTGRPSHATLTGKPRRLNAAAGGTRTGRRLGVSRVGFRQAVQPFRPSGRSPPGSRKDCQLTYGPPPFSGLARVANGHDARWPAHLCVRTDSRSDAIVYRPARVQARHAGWVGLSSLTCLAIPRHVPTRTRQADPRWAHRRRRLDRRPARRHSWAPRRLPATRPARRPRRRRRARSPRPRRPP